MRNIKSIALEPEPAGRIRYLSKDEYKRLIAAVKPHQVMSEIVPFALNTGLRRGSIFDLKWCEVDLDNGFLHIPETKNRDRLDAPMNAVALSVIKSRGKKKQGEHVFHNNGERWTDLSDAWETVSDLAELTNFRFHDLRHTFISYLVMNGVDIRTVQELAGHKTLTMTMKYAHLSPDHKSQAINLLDFETVGKNHYTKTIQSKKKASRKKSVKP